MLFFPAAHVETSHKGCNSIWINGLVSALLSTVQRTLKSMQRFGGNILIFEI